MIMQGYRVEYPEGPFTVVDLPRPTPIRDQVLVRIHAAGINPLDTKIRSGSATHAKQPLPAILGVDMSGIVEAVGPDVTTFRGGDEVYGMVGGVGGRQGTLAQYIVVNADLLALKPKSLTMREAAALPLITITAWQGLIDQAHVRKGQRVLVHAGAGGVGHIAVQLAKSFGADVFATVSPEKEHVVKNLGAVSILFPRRSTSRSTRKVRASISFMTLWAEQPLTQRSKQLSPIPAMWSVALDGPRIHSHRYRSVMQPIPECLL